jgi:hypothetical protein
MQAPSKGPTFLARAKPWLRPVASLLFMGAIFGWMALRVYKHWDDVRGRVHEISWPNFVIASFLFALFLFVFRSLVWRRILKRLGHRLPIAPAVRIWSSSELARYIPGVIWQVAGRVYLLKPYGVSGSICAASQVLELVIFLLANILLGVGCLLVFGIRHVHDDARHWMFILAAMIPLLASMLHPRVFYAVMNRIMVKLKKPALLEKLNGFELTRLLVWNILGLLVQSLAVFLIVSKPLHLQIDKWYVVTGAYCIAWCAGFLAILNPGGLGVREWVFVVAMRFVLPASVKDSFQSPAALKAYLMFLGGILRLWTIAGELILSGASHAFDHQGAIGRGPGTVPLSTAPLPANAEPATGMT